MDAMVIGEDAFIDRSTRVDFQRSGTYHVLVVSGMNVSILAMVTFWTLRRLRLGELVAGIATIVLTVSYAVLTNVGPPIWRATLMLVVYLCARWLYREKSMLNAIGAAALALMVADPRVLFGASFELTFLCVWLVAAVGIPLLERTLEPIRRGLRYLDSTGYDYALAPKIVQFRLDLRMIAGRIGNFLGRRIPLPLLALAARVIIGTCELLAISLVMQVGLALPMAYYFHRATVVALPANMLVVPLTEVLMPSAVLALVLGYVSLLLAKIPAGRGCSARGDCGHSALAGWAANCGYSRAYPGNIRHSDGSIDSGPGNAFDQAKGDIGGGWVSGVGLQRFLDLCWSGAAAGPSRSAGGDDD